jgi:hypothetical protein
MLGHYVCCGMSCMRCVHRRVAMLSIMSLLPSYIHTKKKKLHLLCEACCPNEMEGSLQDAIFKRKMLYRKPITFWYIIICHHEIVFVTLFSNLRKLYLHTILKIENIYMGGNFNFISYLKHWYIVDAIFKRRMLYRKPIS